MEIAWKIKTIYCGTFLFVIETEEEIKDFDDFLKKSEKTLQAYFARYKEGITLVEIKEERNLVRIEMTFEKKDINHFRIISIRKEKMLLSGEEILSKPIPLF